MARLGRAQPAPPFLGRVPQAQTLAGLDLNSSTYEFGQRTGLAITDFALYASASLALSVYADSLPLGAPLFSYTETTGANGQLTRKTDASLTLGLFYYVAAVTNDGTKRPGMVRMQAT